MDPWSLANLTNSMVYELKRLLEEIINKMNCQIFGDVYFSTFFKLERFESLSRNLLNSELEI